MDLNNDIKGISRIVSQFDPMFLIEQGAPDDEYSSEVELLSQILKDSPNLPSLRQAVTELFSYERFGVNPREGSIQNITQALGHMEPNNI